MNKNTISLFTSKIFDFYGISYNPIELKKNLINHDGDKVAVLHEFVDLLVDSGSISNLIFIKNSIDENELQNLLQNVHFPILLFQKMDTHFIPTLLTPGKDKHFEITGDLIGGDNTSYIVNDIQAFAANLLKQENSDSYLVLSCFPNSTQMTEDDDEFQAPNPEDRNIDSVFYETTSKTFNRLLAIFAAEKKDIYHLYFYAAIVGLISLSLPIGIQSIIGFISSGQYSTSLVVLIGLIVVGIVLNGGLHIMQVWIVEIIQQRMFTKTAFDFAFRFPKIKMESLKNYYPPELINRFFDVITLQKGFAKILTDLLGAFIQIAFGLLLLSLYHAYFIIFGLVLIAILVIILRISGPKGLETSMYESKYKYQLVHWLQEVGRTLRSFKMAGFTNLPVDKADFFVSNYLKSRNKHFKILMKQYVSFVLFKTLIIAGLLSLGCILVINKEINLGQFVASEIIIILVMEAVEKVIKNLDSVYDVLTSLEKIGTVQDFPMEENKGINPNKIITADVGFEIKIKELRFSYPGSVRESLYIESFLLKPNEKICISGYNDAGKSTLLQCITGMISDYSGTVAFNGISLQNFNKTALYNHIGTNINENIFDGSLVENLTMGNSKIKIADIMSLLDSLNLNDFVLELPDGLNANISGGSIRASKSTINKILLVRALLKRPKLLIIGDNYSQNNTNRIFLYEQIMRITPNCTFIFVSNDPDVMKLCDTIAIMKTGKIIHQGSFGEVSQTTLFKEVCNK